tara:strand:- start:62515 stop:62835 length:321 start_codon:yes stop_codon:yes gene_type:complete
MKTLQKINVFFLSMTILLSLLSIINTSFLIGTMISLFLLGVYQGFTGVILFLSHPARIQYVLYLSGLLFVFLLIWLDTEWLWMIPPIPLAMYFTFLLHTKKPQIIL